MRLINTRTQQIVASSVELARSRSARKRGLLGRPDLPEGRAMMIAPCFAIHTFGMQFAIDVAFVDKKGAVRKIVRDLPPGRMAIAPTASVVVEFAAGALGSDAVRCGDRLYLVPESADAVAVGATR